MIEASKPLKSMKTNGAMVLNTLFGLILYGGTRIKDDFLAFSFGMRCSEGHD